MINASTASFKSTFRTIAMEVSSKIHAGRATSHDLDKLRFFLSQSIYHELDADLLDLRADVRQLADKIQCRDDEFLDVPIELVSARLQSIFQSARV